MDILKRTDLKKLTETSGEWCISIYMPSHRVGREQQQDPILFRNLVAQANERLMHYGLRVPDIQRLLAPAESLLTNHDFWQHQSDGLAVFLSPQAHWVYRLPRRFDDLMVISRNFHIKPLLPLLNGNGQFYILALSQNHIRLFLGTRDQISEMELEGFSTSLEEALWMDDPEKHLEVHSMNSAGHAGARQAAFHGHGANIEVQKTNILRFFQYVDRSINDQLVEKDLPMVLAGVDYLLPIYRETNGYPNLMAQGLEGNPDELSGRQLHERAWALVEPLFNQDRQRVVDHLHQLTGQKSKLATTDLKTILAASSFGRVETLILPSGVRIWGRYDTRQNKVTTELQPTMENIDLLDFAAAQTILHEGMVYTVLPKELPDGSMPSAILRYAV